MAKPIHDNDSCQFIDGENYMKDNLLVVLSKQYSINIVNLCTDIKENRKGSILLNQLLRCSTSIGANIHEANYAASRADFTNKLQIALKECFESDYWLEIFKETKIITEEEFEKLHQDCSKLRNLLSASIKTAKRNAKTQ